MSFQIRLNQVGNKAYDQFGNQVARVNAYGEEEASKIIADVVRAVNSHYQLVEALERLLEYVLDPIEHSIHDVEPLAQAALQAAKGVA